ncbi:MAG: hypothetical protein WCH21_08900 [Bacteroidota bacterium]
MVYKLTQLTNDYWHTMYVLYALAVPFFGFSYILFKKGQKAMGNLTLGMAMFLNPLGYDWVVYGVNYLTHDYWMTMSIMYTMAAFFFAVFMYLYNINLIKAFSHHAKKTHNHIKTKIIKNG